MVIGESYAGDRDEAAHINTARGGPVNPRFRPR
jgi:hypothetical protein